MNSDRSPAIPFGTRLASHVRAGIAAACVATLIDAVGLLVESPAVHSWAALTAFVLALLHLGAWQATLGAAFGGFVSLVAQAAGGAPQKLGSRWGIDGLRGWFSRSETFAADLVASVVVVVTFLFAFVRVERRIFASFHDAILAEWAVALAAVGLAVALAILAPVLGAALRRFLRPLASALLPGLVIVVAFEFVVVTFEFLRETRPTLVAGLDRRLLAFIAFVPTAYFVTLSLGRRREPRWVRRRAWRGAAAALLAFTGSALLYDSTSTQRRLVEESSLLGRYEVRALQDLADRDRDGYGARFGGGDCNDRRADVHPQAVDRKGDGIDADCFAGDGAPVFDDLARVPLTQARPTTIAHPNIVLITVDALRPDHLGVLGYPHATSPKIDAFARTATVFRDVTAGSPRTVRSFGALLTGDYPGQIQYEVVHLWPELLASNTTIAERLRQTYMTSAVLESDYFTKARGFAQGFDRITIPPFYKPPRGGSRDRGIQEVRALTSSLRPFFLWIHLFNVHEPYLADGSPTKFDRGVVGAYDTEVAYADETVGAILDALRESGAWDRTVVAIASDHGEALGEHRAFGHSTSLYDEQLRSVMMVRFPAYAPKMVDTPVALFDLYATLLDVTGTAIDTPTAARSLLPLARGDDSAFRNRPIFAEVFPDGTYGLEAYGIRRGRYKLIEFPRTNRHELYDLHSDPHELFDISDRERATAGQLRNVLLRWVIATHRPENATSNVVTQSRMQSVPPDVPMHPNLRFGSEIALEGVRIGAAARRGELLPLDLYFRCLAPIPGDYWFHITFEALGDVSLPSDFEAHHQPVQGRYPTSRWIQGELVHDRVLVRIPDSVPDGARIRARLEIWPEPNVPLPFDRNGRRETSFELGEFVVP